MRIGKLTANEPSAIAKSYNGQALINSQSIIRKHILTGMVSPSVIVRTFSRPKFCLNLTVAGAPTSRAICVLSLLKFTESVTMHIQSP